MEGNVLVDSSFYINRMRSGKDPAEELSAHLGNIDLFTCGVVMAEVLRGMRIRAARNRLQAVMSVFLYVPTINSIWEEVTELAWELERKGLTMQITDLVIAVSALRVDAAVLTFDGDFKSVPGLRVIDSLE